MKKKNLVMYLITAVLLIAWLYLAFINFRIAAGPFRKMAAGEFTFTQARDTVAADYTEKLKGKYKFINLNGLYTKLSGGRKCNEVIKLKDGNLTLLRLPYDTTANAEKAIALKEKLDQKGIGFLYVQSPYKTNDELMPYGLTNSADANIDNFLTHLDSAGVPYVDLRQYLTDSPEHIDEYFYVTDHHWTPVGAFVGFQKISEYLQGVYPKEKINGDVQVLDNWNINSKEDWFLGSNGKRTGTYFGGVDDLIWLTPKFETQMSFLSPYKDEYHSGDFTDANLHLEYTEKKDYFDLNPYCIYVGGEYALVQHRNATAPVDKKVLIIKDSFALPLQCFFSTLFREVDVYDPRFYTAGTLYEYIEESQPDMVIMDLSGVSVDLDLFFETGVDTARAHGTPGKEVGKKETVKIEADDKDDKNSVAVFKDLKAGKRYTLLCDSVKVDQGDAKAISIKLRDPSTKEKFDRAIWDIDYCEKAGGKTGSFEWTFTAPEDVDNTEIRIYAGIAGETKGNGITLKNLRLLEE